MPQGEVIFTWSSETTWCERQSRRCHDYAHINSIQVIDDGDILLSFRISARSSRSPGPPTTGSQPGDVVWRLGGRRSNFTFVNDPYADGPCAQHMATQLPKVTSCYSTTARGRSTALRRPGEPVRARFDRSQTRIAEYALDLDHGTATPVWDYEVPGRFALFAGRRSVSRREHACRGASERRRSPRSSITPAVALGADRRQPDASAALLHLPGGRRYRPRRHQRPTLTSPPGAGATYALGQAVTIDFVCTDRGGSSLASCQSGPAHSGGVLDTTGSGTHTFTVQAIDGSGNLTSVTRTYHVVTEPGTAHRPPLRRRHPRSGPRLACRRCCADQTA